MANAIISDGQFKWRLMLCDSRGMPNEELGGVLDPTETEPGEIRIMATLPKFRTLETLFEELFHTWEYSGRKAVSHDLIESLANHTARLFYNSPALVRLLIHLGGERCHAGKRSR
jgi:hypothetical protein